MEVVDDGEVFGGGAEVLAEGEDGDFVGEQIVHGAEDFLVAFAKAEHHAGFGGDVAVCHLFGFFEDCEGALVFCAGADEGGEALDGFQVVVKDVGAGVHDKLEGPVTVIEVRDEDFDDDSGVLFPDGADGFLEMLCASVLEIVTSDGGDDDVLEVHAVGCLGDACGFIFFEGVWTGGFDGAETAGAGAFIAGDHEGGGALAPAFPAVWALCFFANGDEFEIGNEGFGRPEGGVVGEADFDPIGFFFPV